jgi:hypothetical protein
MKGWLHLTIIVVSFLVFVVPALSSTAGWFPQHQGWYPKIGPFTAVDTNKVMKNWKPKNHELCAEASKGWNDWIEGKPKIYFNSNNSLKI